MASAKAKAAAWPPKSKEKQTRPLFTSVAPALVAGVCCKPTHRRKTPAANVDAAFLPLCFRLAGKAKAKSLETSSMPVQTSAAPPFPLHISATLR
jgi:hypothetical protein